MRFEWDSEKADRNFRKHTVSFDEAKTVFDDPLFIIFAKLAERSFWYTVLTTASLLFLGIFLAQFVRGHWVFG